MGSPKPGRTQPLVEDEILERIRSALEGGIGGPDLHDDAATLSVPGGSSVVLSVDSVVEGVHVDLALCSPADVGWKALMGALSDLAAMGARPLGALVALCVPSSSGEGSLAVGVMKGAAEASAAIACPIIGGDVSSGAELVVTVTVVGTVDDGEPVTRSGALAGDVVMVSGPCGGSAAGLRVLRAAAGTSTGDGSASEFEDVERALATAYRRPVARLAEGMAARRGGAHALMDISDGLALDLHRLATASGVGFALDDVPVTAGATMTEALGGGEDYELIMAIAPRDVPDVTRGFVEASLRTPVAIGVITADASQRALQGRALAPLGWQHLLG